MSILDGSGGLHRATLIGLAVVLVVLVHLVHAHGNVRVSRLKDQLELSGLVGRVTHIGSRWGRHTFRLDGGMLFSESPAQIHCRAPFWTLKYGPNTAGDQQTCRMNAWRQVDIKRYEYFLRKVAQATSENAVAPPPVHFDSAEA